MNRNYFKYVCSMDYRTLAVFRMGLGILVFMDMFLRLWDVQAHYSDFGILPRVFFLQNVTQNHEWSFLLAHGSSAFAAGYLLLIMLSSVFLFFGYKTRFFSIFIWLLIVSLQNRNQMIQQGGDGIERMILFWAMFLPMGRKWSIDEALSSQEPTRLNQTSEPFHGIFAWGYFIQICCLYFFTGYLKSGDEWLNGTAVYYTLNIDFLGHGLFRVIREFPMLMTFSNYLVLLAEMSFVFLFLCPFFRPQIRMFLFISISLMHIMFGLCLRISIFWWTDIVSLMPLVPSEFWNYLERKFLSKSSPMIIYFDDGCGFCRKSVFMMKSLFFGRNVEVRESSQNAQVMAEMIEKKSWVVQSAQGETFTEYEAFLQILKNSYPQKLFYPFAILMRSFGRKVYRSVADHRDQTGSVFSFIFPWNGKEISFKFITVPVAIYSIWFVVYWNLISLPQFQLRHSFDFLNWPGLVFRLDQKWDMFAPYPMKSDGFFVFEGNTYSGKMVDPWNLKNSPPDFSIPKNYSETYPNFRWGKYLLNIWNDSYSAHREQLNQYLCRNWNLHFPNEPLKEVKIYLFFELTHVDHITLPEKKLLHLSYCINR